MFYKSDRAERHGMFDAAIALLDQASGIKRLPDYRRVQRARLLLRAQRLPDAQSSLSALRKEFSNSDDPDRQYLRRWCTATLSLMVTSPAQFDHEARAAEAIRCSAHLRQRFPLWVEPDED